MTTALSSAQDETGPVVKVHFISSIVLASWVLVLAVLTRVLVLVLVHLCLAMILGLL